MQNHHRTPAPTDKDGALDFEERPEKAPPPVLPPTIIHMAFQGVPIDIPIHASRRKIEALVRDLLANGWTAPPQPKSGGFGGKPDTRIDPAFDDAGNEICPVHRVKVRPYKTQDGREFKGCPSKGTGVAGEKLNARGYCELRFK